MKDAARTQVGNTISQSSLFVSRAGQVQTARAQLVCQAVVCGGVRLPTFSPLCAERYNGKPRQMLATLVKVLTLTTKTRAPLAQVAVLCRLKLLERAK